MSVRPQFRKRRVPWGRLAVAVILTFVALVVVVLPLWIALVTSFKPLAEAKLLSPEWPRQWQAVENYTRVIETSQYGRGFWNSLVVTSASVTACLLLGSMASWVFARNPSRVVRALYVLAVAGIIVPAAIVPSIALLRLLGLQGTHLGLVTVYVAGMLSIAVFIMTGFVRTIPTELEDAARIDGCGELGVFFRIVAPLLQPALLSVGTILTIVIWTEFFSAFLILSGRESQTLPLGLWYVSAGAINQVQWNLVFTHVVLVSSPLIVFYFVVQRGLESGLLMGSLRG